MKFHLGSPPAGLIYTVGFSATSRNAVTLSRRWRERSALGRGAANRAGRRSPAIAVTVASINSRKSGLGPQTLPYPIRHKNSPEPLPTPRGGRAKPSRRGVCHNIVTRHSGHADRHRRVRSTQCDVVPRFYARNPPLFGGDGQESSDLRIGRIGQAGPWASREAMRRRFSQIACCVKCNRDVGLIFQLNSRQQKRSLRAVKERLGVVGH